MAISGTRHDVAVGDGAMGDVPVNATAGGMADASWMVVRRLS